MIDLDTLYLFKEIPPDLTSLKIVHDATLRQNISLKKNNQNLKTLLWIAGGSAILAGIFFYIKKQEDDERRKKN